MPRDGGGTYTLPAGNPVIPGTIIETTWANPTMNDIAAALTDSLSRTGSGGMLVPFLNADGTVGLPGISWANQQNMGIYRPGLDEMRISVAGVDKSRWTSDANNPMDIWVSSSWQAVMHEGGDYSPTGNWDFSGAASFILGPTPVVPINETGATADEGNWNFRATGDELVLATATDAAPTVDVENAFWVTRTATAVDYTQFLNEIRVGGSTSAYGVMRHGITGPTEIDSQNTNQLHFMPTSENSGLARFGPGNTALVPFSLSVAGQNQSVQVTSQTSGDQVGWTVYCNDGIRNWASFFGIHDNDAWGLSCNVIGSGTPTFIVECEGESLFRAVLNGASSMYHNNTVAIRTRSGTGDNTRGEVLHADGAYHDIGLAVMPILEQDSNVTLGTSQNQKLLHKDSGGTVTYTLDNNSAIQHGTVYTIVNEDTEVLNINQGGGVTLRWFDGTTSGGLLGNRDLASGGAATVVKYIDTEYFIWGVGLS